MFSVYQYPLFVCIFCRCPANSLQKEDGLCVPGMGKPLGIRVDGRIPDSALTASSDFLNDGLHFATNGRLNFVPVIGSSTGAWLAAKSDPNKWIKVSLYVFKICNWTNE